MTHKVDVQEKESTLLQSCVHPPTNPMSSKLHLPSPMYFHPTNTQGDKRKGVSVGVGVMYLFFA